MLICSNSTAKAQCTPPELLEMIMEHQGRGTLASCVLVCRSWSDVALRRLWRELDSPMPLLELLAALHPIETKEGTGIHKAWVRISILVLIANAAEGCAVI